MENVYHQKDNQGFLGEFMTKFEPQGKYLATCSSACINNLLQKDLLPPEMLGIYLDDDNVSDIVESLQVKQKFNLSEITELYLLDWTGNNTSMFGSLLTMYKALKTENLTLRPLTARHSACEIANACPEAMNGYLYFLEDHWVVMRQLGGRWYKLDPCLDGPQILAPSHVSLYIKQLIADGNLVFLVDGEFPLCPADANRDLSTDEELMPHIQGLSLEGVEADTDSDATLAYILSLEEEDGNQVGLLSTSRNSSNNSTLEKRFQAQIPQVQEEDEKVCCVCLEEPASHAMVPCGHLCLCGSCSKKLSGSCPLCKQSASTIIKIYK